MVRTDIKNNIDVFNATIEMNYSDV
jgi:hypothetical protein